jgi:Cu(I)/Ag(I) efflux system membrane fusion protein
MELAPVYAEDAAKSIVSLRESRTGAAQIDASAQQLYGIKLARVERDQGKTLIQVFARVVPDETRIYRVNFGTDGYVKETHDDAVGTFVKKDQHLATVYSPEFLSVAGGYLAAHERDPMPVSAASGSGVQNASQETASVQARADRLRNLGMSDIQIQEITHTRKLPENIYVVSPTEGFIVSRNISPGMRFQRQSDLYSIADLSHVWIEAEVFGRDAKALHPGVVANVVLRDTGQRIRARVNNVLPEVDANTHALKVRLEADNPGFKLRPNMFVTLEVPVVVPAGSSVPIDAIVDSGIAKRVYVQVSQGVFEPRPVETGWQIGDRVQVVKGLMPDELIVASGAFLVDSESRIQAGTGAISQVRDAPAQHSASQ